MRHLLAATLTLASTLLLSSGADAQQRSALTLDASIGWSSGRTNGEYRDDRRGPAADVLLALRFRPVAAGALVAGVSASAQGVGATDDLCVPASTGGCIPTFPGFEMIGALVGWQNAGATVRVMGGPAYVQADWRGWAVGWQGRLDGALPVARHVAVVGSARGTVVPSYRGDAFRLIAFGVGLRIH